MKSNYSKDVPHEDLKVFKCTTCDKDFGLNSDLNRHIKNVHEKQKDYKCDFCGK